MRGTLPEAREVLDMHTQLLNDLNVIIFLKLTSKDYGNTQQIKNVN